MTPRDPQMHGFASRSVVEACGGQVAAWGDTGRLARFRTRPRFAQRQGGEGLEQYVSPPRLLLSNGPEG